MPLTHEGGLMSFVNKCFYDHSINIIKAAQIIILQILPHPELIRKTGGGGGLTYSKYTFTVW